MIFIKSLILTTTLMLTPVERPHLVIAQGLVESGMNQYAVGKAKERGAWQVIARHWGRVPRTLINQQKQHSRIMRELVEEHGSVELAVKRYNGAGRGAERYLAKVRLKTLELTILGV